MRHPATGLQGKADRALQLACLCLLTLIACLGPSVHSAYGLGTEPLSENFIPRFSEFGPGAGQVSIPASIGIEQATGNLYVADWSNERIDEFSPWGNFIKAFGWGVADGASKELQTCTTTCLAGLAGTGPGQFITPWGIVFDPSNGNLYISDGRDPRVQEFTPSGQFVLMFGGEVDKTKVHQREDQEAKAEPVTVSAEEEDLCTQSSGDECGAGTEGARHGQIAGGDIALSPSGGIVARSSQGVQEFSAGGAYQSEVQFAGGGVQRFAVDPTSGDFFVTRVEGKAFSPEKIYELSPTGALLRTIEVQWQESQNKKLGQILADSAGHVYVAASGVATQGGYFPVDRILQLDASDGHLISEFTLPQFLREEAEVYGFAINSIGDLYFSNHNSNTRISYLSAFGPPPVAFEPPPRVAPTIESQYALSVDLNGAVLQARINPHFWNDTTYYVEYGTSDCEGGGCAAEPAAPGSRLTSKVVAQAVAGQSIPLTGLTPNTTYHYRFVAQSTGGGPVFGPDRSFTTAPAFEADTACPNQSLRTGFSAQLPDCRAYELVSPIDKNGGDIINLTTLLEIRNGLNQSATDGDGFTYSSDRAFANSVAGSYVNQYMARRDPSTGWSSEAISPPQQPKAGIADPYFQTLYKFFSPDLAHALLTPLAEPPLAPGAVTGEYSLYQRTLASGELQTLATTEGTPPEVQGASLDGSRAVFRTSGVLTPDASTQSGIEQIYEYDGEGALRLVSVLPNGTPLSLTSSVGSGNSAAYDGVFASVDHAVSNDASRVYWSESEGEKLGKLYLRENANQPQSQMSGSECTEPEEACTISVSSKPAQFWAASADGSKALYTVKEREGTTVGTLSEFNLEEESSKAIAKKVEGVVGASEDLSYIYFVSTEALAPGAISSQPNLYVSHEEEIGLVGTLDSSELSLGFSPIERIPIFHTARVTPDGRHLAFEAKVSLTGYDNTDTVTNKPDYEVYVYDAVTHTLDCASCDRSGARPTGREVHRSDSDQTLPLAGWIPGGENELYASRVLSDDGDRLFFESYTPLVVQDTNGKADVYEWEASGAGDCHSGGLAFSPANGGCVRLISSGESPQDSKFLDASPSGDDVFFTTAASLLPQDPGSVDVYDARVDGGFPPPPAPPASCEGEACQGAPSPPNDQTPASATFSGPGNLLSSPLESASAKRRAAAKTVAQSRAAKLAKALKRCRSAHMGKARKGKARRKCEATARKRYAVKHQAKKSSKGRGK